MAYISTQIKDITNPERDIITLGELNIYKEYICIESFIQIGQELYNLRAFEENSNLTLIPIFLTSHGP